MPCYRFAKLQVGCSGLACVAKSHHHISAISDVELAEVISNVPTKPTFPTRSIGFVAFVAILATTFGLAPAPAPPAGAAGGGVADLTGAIPATFTVKPGVELVTVTGAPAHTPLTLVNAASLERIVTVYTDDLGQLVISYVPTNFLVADPSGGILPTTDGGTLKPGSYRIISEGVPGQPFAGPLQASNVFDVLSVDDTPDPTFYSDQVLPFVSATLTGGVAAGHSDEEGFGYLKTRDGTLLSVNVRLPDRAQYGPGPYPTVIQYSGYAPSRPGTPSGADAGGVLANALGFAYVGVNVRGSGCSGGTFDVFNAAQAADGYDAVEIVARQPWVKNARPGMMGISYSGITQLYVAATRPPSLAAITPVSVIEDPWYQQWPGGIYNSGFTRAWLASRDDEAIGGAGWVQDRITAGDTTCQTNLRIRSQNISFEAFAKSLERRPPDANERNLSLKARQINVPVFLTGAWQDEQTGAQFAALLDDFTSVLPGQTKFTMYNGQHNDGFSPLIFSRWFEFLSFYVDKTVPRVNPLVRFGAPDIFADMFGYEGLGFEPNRFLIPFTNTPIAGDYAGALRSYEAENQVRVLFEVGDSPDFPTDAQVPRQRYEMSFPSWPPTAAGTKTLYLGPAGTLNDSAPAQKSADRFSFDPTVLGKTWNEPKPPAPSTWAITPDGKGLAYETAPLTQDLVVLGSGHLDLWIKSTGSDAPLEIVLSEVYADPDSTDSVGPEEVRVQHGLLRAAYSQLDPSRSAGTQVDHLFYAQNYLPLTGEWRNVQVPLYAVGHAFRAGSRLRIEINTPGGDAPTWSFESPSYGATTNDVAWGGNFPSALVLPVLPATPALAVPEAFAGQANHPSCNWLRHQPCRAYHHLENQSVQIVEPTTTTSSTSTSSTTTSSTTTTVKGGDPPPHSSIYTSSTSLSVTTSTTSTTIPVEQPSSPTQAQGQITTAPAQPITRAPSFTG